MFLFSVHFTNVLSWYTFDAAVVISNSCIVKKTIQGEDRGGKHDLFSQIMHSWVGYELVRVILAFELSPKLRDDLKEWSPDLFNVFSYLGNQQRDFSKKEEVERILQILFDNTEHSSYFGKLPFGKKTKFVKMPHVTIPLVVLTWLRQLQEHFYSLASNNEGLDWNDNRRYVNAPIRLAVKGGVNNIYVRKANNKGGFYKISTFDDLKPNRMDSDKVVKSLYDWAEMILYWDVTYVQEITKSIEGKKNNKGCNTVAN